jgi:tRNA dimethylallyltransferase
VQIDFDNQKPILIAGPTASGKSALGIKLAREHGGVVINADALQVYRQWHVLTARPDDSETSQCLHWMYGHVDIGMPYSVGHWLTGIKKCLKDAHSQNLRPIILGGTGLYFQMLTQGLAPIPEISDETKRQADEIENTVGKNEFASILADKDPKTFARIDTQNPMRTRRAWEVLIDTGKGLSDWQDDTPPPILDIRETVPVNLVCNTQWLNARIEKRFHMMIDAGALDECRAVLGAGLWDENHPSCRAIGARELINHIENGTDIETEIDHAIIQTRQYAKRQRTWFRSKMSNWNALKIDTA